MSDIGDVVASQSAMVNGILGLGMSIAGLTVNGKQNKRNLAQQQWANVQNVKQAELAYQRSKPTTQVGNMIQAGMSRAGALNAINGGGSYTPAPVQPAQEQMLDFSGMQNALANIAQLKQEEKLAMMTLSAQKEENAANRENAKEIAQIQADASKYGADSSAGASKYSADKSAESAANMLSWEREKFDKLPEYDKERYDLATQLLRHQKNLEQWKVNDLKYRVLEYQSAEYKSTRDAENLLRDIAADLQYELNSKELYDFRDTYMYFDLDSKEWRYKQANNAAGRWLYENAPLFWDFVARVLPANKIADIIARGLRN